LEIAMAAVVGIVLMLSTLVVQGAAATVGVELISALLARRDVGARLWSNALATLALIVMLLIGHLAQIAAWAATFLVAGEFSGFPVAFYHSAVNYTTLGYGDIVMSQHWRLLGPLEAATGTLAFGWSTAAIVTVVIDLFRTRRRLRAGLSLDR
jgi:voltage-gated potassium channel Kch